MRAAVVDRYGPPEVVGIADLPRPTPGADDVVVRVVSAAVTAGDARIRAARFPAGFAPVARMVFGLRRPRRRVLGTTFSGVVEAVGENVTEIAPGDEACGMTGIRMGAHAEFVRIPATRAIPKPEQVDHDQAAGLLFGGTTALHYLRDKAGLRPGRSVLVNGAAGAVGTNAVQLARHLGAHVTAVTSAPNARLVTDLGADRVIDYATTELAALPDRFDVVLDAVGNLGPADLDRLVTDDGVLLLAVATLGQTLRARGRIKAGSSPESPADMAELLRLAADGTIVAVIDEVLGLDEIVAAYRRVDTGHKVGNVLVRP